jgi:protein-tyrosine phosphatase
MNQASFFIDKKALFGGYPNHKQITELKEEGVVWFVDLTTTNEHNITAYSHLVNNWLNYPIKDRHIPENKKNFTIFLIMIQMIVESLKPGEKMYLHCRGGHGRSSLVVSCFFSLFLKMNPIDSLNLAKECHSLRPNLNPRWLLRWPLNLKQRKFVESFYGNIYLYSNFQNKYEITTKSEFFRSMIFLNFYLHQHPIMLDVLLNSGLKTIKGEGITSLLLQELRWYILYSKAKKIFEFN